ncbi:hypothetical protein [Nocardiopsis trehalosi]|uniref:hypothetical protein n=1 Tax=Nocardiopsis trehalosi TaxID=109329 RepID=UPI000A06B54F|nr:hypothetical protein [Nocardiopsis trehalosi]
MPPSESSVSGSRGRRRKTDEADAIEGLAAPARRTGAKGSRRRRKGGGKKRSPLLLVLLGLLGAAVVALAVVLVLRFTGGGAAAPENARPAAYGVFDSQNISEALPTREADRRPLAEGEMFERGNEEIDSRGITFTLAASSLSDDCAGAVWGDAVTEALAAADCTQVARAGYTSDEYVGVAAMFNLADTEAAQAVAESMEPPTDPEAEAPGFVLPPTDEEPFNVLGAGFSQAEATVSGHFLVVTWTQATDSTDPAEREQLTSPLIALSGFQDPLYRRVVQMESSGAGSATEPATEPGADTTGTEAPDGTAGTGTEVPQTGTEVPGTGTGTEVPTG